jgi:hypothetical protein
MCGSLGCAFDAKPAILNKASLNRNALKTKLAID